MKIKMELLSDAIFGNGISVPGGEDISILTDQNGFPYYKGGTFKGIFREELENYLNFTVTDKETDVHATIDRLLGRSGSDQTDGQLVFSDFCLSDTVKEAVLAEVGHNREAVTEIFTNLRTFTSINDNGVVKEGSLRIARCADKGMVFYSEIWAQNEEDEKLAEEVMTMIRWIGTMRNKGFGKVKITKEEN